MKNLLLLFTLFIAINFASAQTFEGKVTMIPDFKTTPDKKNEMVFYVKGDNVVLEPNGAGSMKARMVGNRKTKEYYMLVETEGKKIALNMNMDQMAGMYGGNPAMSQTQQQTHSAPATTTETGATRVIDGYTCRQIISQSGESKTEMWVTNEMDLALCDLLFSPHIGTQYKSYGNSKGMVLEAWSSDSKGKITTSMKLIPERKAVDDNMFGIPEGYVKMDMMQMMQVSQGNPEMMQQIMQMMGGQK